MAIANRALQLAWVLPAFAICAQISNSTFAQSPTGKVPTTVVDYFLQLKSMGANDGSLIIKEKDIPNGFLQATGNFDGYLIYKLYSGIGRDLLVKQVAAGSGAMTQNFVVYSLRGAQIKELSFDQVFPKTKLQEHVSTFQEKLPALDGSEAYKLWYWVRRKSRSIDVVLLSHPVGELPADGKVYLAAGLEWNGYRFSLNTRRASTRPLKVKAAEIL